MFAHPAPSHAFHFIPCGIRFMVYWAAAPLSVSGLCFSDFPSRELSQFASIISYHIFLSFALCPPPPFVFEAASPLIQIISGSIRSSRPFRSLPLELLPGPLHKTVSDRYTCPFVCISKTSVGFCPALVRRGIPNRSPHCHSAFWSGNPKN